MAKKKNTLYIRFLWSVYKKLLDCKLFITAMKFRIYVIKNRYLIEE
jgi:hypothetical protein